MIALIDYRAGNLTSVRKALAAVGAEVHVPGSPAELEAAAAIIVPGVGHFNATRVLDAEWRRAITSAMQKGRPLLGICLGLQWLFEGSTEAPDCPGLGLMRGTCDRLPSAVATPDGASETLKVPHVGWNALRVPRPSVLLDGVSDGDQVYFTHSYAAPVTPDTIAITTYGVPFASAVERGRVFGVQFHPEKSGDVGLTVLRNFMEVTKQQ